MDAKDSRVIRAKFRSVPADNEHSAEAIKALQAFLKRYNHSMVAQRKKAAIERCIDFGRILLCEKLEVPSRINKIAGCALQYDLCDQRYVEIGSIRVPGKAGLGGFGLQSVLISIASCQLLMTRALGEDGYAPDEFFATIAPENLKIQGPKFEALGMVPWANPPEELKAAKSETVSLGSDHPLFFRIPLETTYDHAKYLCEIIDGTYIPKRMAKDGVEETLEIEFDLFLFRRLEGALREMAAKSKKRLADIVV